MKPDCLTPYYSISNGDRNDDADLIIHDRVHLTQMLKDNDNDDVVRNVFISSILKYHWVKLW